MRCGSRETLPFHRCVFVELLQRVRQTWQFDAEEDLKPDPIPNDSDTKKKDKPRLTNARVLKEFFAEGCLITQQMYENGLELDRLGLDSEPRNKKTLVTTSLDCLSEWGLDCLPALCQILPALLEGGARLDVQLNKSALTPLHMAASVFGHIENEIHAERQQIAAKQRTAEREGQQGQPQSQTQAEELEKRGEQLQKKEKVFEELQKKFGETAKKQKVLTWRERDLPLSGAKLGCLGGGGGGGGNGGEEVREGGGGGSRRPSLPSVSSSSSSSLGQGGGSRIPKKELYADTTALQTAVTWDAPSFVRVLAEIEPSLLKERCNVTEKITQSTTKQSEVVGEKNGVPTLHLPLYVAKRPSRVTPSSLIFLGCDPCAVDGDGESILHRLARVSKWSDVQANFKEAQSVLWETFRKDQREGKLEASTEASLVIGGISASPPFSDDSESPDYSPAVSHSASPANGGGNSNSRPNLRRGLSFSSSPSVKRLVRLTNKKGQSALHVAGFPDIFVLLLEAGADGDARDHEGIHWLDGLCSRLNEGVRFVPLHTKLMSAVRDFGVPLSRAHAVLTEFIAIKKLDKEAAAHLPVPPSLSAPSGDAHVNGDGSVTLPLHVACRNCGKGWADQLLSLLPVARRGTKANLRDNEGSSVLHYPEVLEAPHFLQKLIEKIEGDRDARELLWGLDRDQKSPLQVCSEMITACFAEMTAVRQRQSWVGEAQSDSVTATLRKLQHRQERLGDSLARLRRVAFLPG
uniref:Uncharacterized protein n=1 Tax=Chromera velia CCMP2878 TaxID=1169474 RepID=A0A0G4G230_9ALVE|eukprot:Cvel_19876.t1-p1 / transcript=Cvel_19876.t1 / gene=Cvel_19876 / organism=Chromera_velia_CCMP2878 / gene_product=hypothetical protein / transcript_product=hypothetical protein / location=Cvel_scaffold1743:33418-36162(-) / protein_length=746 / sequence_SO=supercontig / SO=protein_coding / is_pseudo=false